MTERLKGCWVAFDRDIREDDVQPIVDAISMIKGVIAVECSTDEPADWMARQRIKNELLDKIINVFKHK